MGNAVRDGMRHPMILRLANVGVGQAAQRGIKTLMEERLRLLSYQKVVDNPKYVTRRMLPSTSNQCNRKKTWVTKK